MRLQIISDEAVKLKRRVRPDAREESKEERKGLGVWLQLPAWREAMVSASVQSKARTYANIIRVACFAFGVFINTTKVKTEVLKESLPTAQDGQSMADGKRLSSQKGSMRCD